MKRFENILLWAALALTLSGCQNPPQSGGRAAQNPPLTPDYGKELAIPCNIAPLNFSLPDSFVRARVEVCSGNKSRVFRIRNKMVFPKRFWRRLLQTAAENTADKGVDIRITARARSGETYSFAPFVWQVREPIDSYLTYRLVQPTDGVYSELDLWERNLENFSVKKLVSNRLMENNCFNCHTYQNGDAQFMSLHFRNPSNGTLLMQNGVAKKIRVPAAGELAEYLADSLRMPLNLVYPAWHPAGEWIVFSTNIVGVGGYAAHKRFFNLLDTASNLVLYNTVKNKIVFDPVVWTRDFEETWPAWSPDGRWLYFCRTAKVCDDTVQRYPNSTERSRHIYFDLVRVKFSAETGCFEDSVEVLFKGAPEKSYSVPRISPDGKVLLYCTASFNSVPYHANGDLLAENLVSGEKIDTEILNSEQSESWHEWSGNAKWIVFASKRADGHYSLPYFSYFDGERFSQPFILPQKDPCFYQTCLRAFNLPTFVKNASPLTPRRAACVQHGKAQKISLE